MVIVGVRNPDEHVYAVNIESGEEEWEYEVGDIRFQSPVVVDSVVFAGDNQTFYGLDLQTGNQLWEYTEDGTNHSLAVANNTVYFGTNSGTVHALEGDARSNPPTTVFQQAQNVADSPLAITGVGAAIAGLGYTAYRRIQSDTTEDSSNNETQQTPEHTSDSSVKDSSADLNSVKLYSEITISDQIKSDYSVCIQNGIVDNHSIWVITPANTGETISTVEATEFVEQTEPWTRMDAHPNLLNVYGSGSDPLPWAAVEQADYRQLSDQVDTLSPDELLTAVEQICEAVHHVHRYGTTYENLTIESVQYTDDNGVKLHGVIDLFDNPDPWYNAPEEFDGELTEQSTVYRIGLIAYELLTGTLPYPEYPTGDPKTVIQNAKLVAPSDHVTDIPEEIDRILFRALSASPDDRFETVLHLRDEFESIRGTL